MGFLGSQIARTPRLDALASESAILSDFVTVVPTTLASHVSLLTGRYPHHHGTPRNGFTVHPDNLMFAEILAAEGFHTAGFLGSFALDSRFGFAQGFEHFDESFDILVGTNGAEQNQRTADRVTEAVLSYLDSTKPSGRLFLFAHYFDPHAPYTAPPPFDRMYDPEGRDHLPNVHAVRKGLMEGVEGAPAAAARMALQYASEISYTDHHVGKLLDGLQERGILEESLVVVTSDHGENLSSHPMPFDHGLTLYDSTMRVVGMIRIPGVEGRTIPGPTSTVDVLPTLLSILDLPAPPGIDGRTIDLAGFRPSPDRPRFGQASKPWREVETDPRWTNILKSRSVRVDAYKLIHTPFRNTLELYDLNTDPGEQHNLIAGGVESHLETAARLRKILDDWADSASPFPSAFDSRQQEEVIRRLRALGYLR